MKSAEIEAQLRERGVDLVTAPRLGLRERNENIQAQPSTKLVAKRTATQSDQTTTRKKTRSSKEGSTEPFLELPVRRPRSSKQTQAAREDGTMPSNIETEQETSREQDQAKKPSTSYFERENDEASGNQGEEESQPTKQVQAASSTESALQILSHIQTLLEAQKALKSIIQDTRKERELIQEELDAQDKENAELLRSVASS